MRYDGLESDINNLTLEQKRLVMNTFLMLNDRIKVAKKCKVIPAVVDQIIIEYYDVLQDVIADQEIKNKVKEDYTESLTRANDIVKTALRLYQHQLAIMDKAYSDSEKLMPDYIVKQIATILETTLPLVQTQMEIAQKNRFELNKNNIELKKLELKSEFDDAMDEYNENVGTIAEFISDVKLFPEQEGQAKKVLVTYLEEIDPETGKPRQMIFHSRYEVARQFGCKTNTIRDCIADGHPYLGKYKFENIK